LEINIDNELLHKNIKRFNRQKLCWY